MSGSAPIGLPPTRLDVKIAEQAAAKVTPKIEDDLGWITLLADEHLVVAAAALFWIYARLGSRETPVRAESAQMLNNVILATALPRLFKRIVKRKRPDRAVVSSIKRNGIPRTGNEWDSFPSGHALQLGAAAGPISRIVSPAARPLVWFGLGALSVTRVFLLAHYVTDVVAGFVIGLAIDRLHRTSGR